MLILSRKPGEEITIDGSVTIRVLSVERGVVRLGIEAPPEVPVYRRELYRAIQQLNQRATLAEVSTLRAALRTARFYAPPACVELPAVSPQPERTPADDS